VRRPTSRGAPPGGRASRLEKIREDYSGADTVTLRVSPTPALCVLLYTGLALHVLSAVSASAATQEGFPAAAISTHPGAIWRSLSPNPPSEDRRGNAHDLLDASMGGNDARTCRKTWGNGDCLLQSYLSFACATQLSKRCCKPVVRPRVMRVRADRLHLHRLVVLAPEIMAGANLPQPNEAKGIRI
jgi:hypothetical protein